MNYVQVFSINLPSSRKFYTNQASVWWSDNPKHGIWLAIIDNLIYYFTSTFIRSEIILSAFLEGSFKVSHLNAKKGRRYLLNMQIRC